MTQPVDQHGHVPDSLCQFLAFSIEDRSFSVQDGGWFMAFMNAGSFIRQVGGELYPEIVVWIRALTAHDFKNAVTKMLEEAGFVLLTAEDAELGIRLVLYLRQSVEDALAAVDAVLRVRGWPLSAFPEASFLRQFTLRIDEWLQVVKQRHGYALGDLLRLMPERSKLDQMPAWLVAICEKP